MAWQEIIFELDREQVELWSDALLDLGALSVNAEDADADSLDEQPLFGEPGMDIPAGWHRTIITALTEQDTHAYVLLRAVANHLEQQTGKSFATPNYRLQTVREQDWVRVTQAQFEPFAIGERLWIRPSWAASPSTAPRDHNSRIELIVDPGLAFGTGSHPTTGLCLRWLEATLPALMDGPQAPSLIDYGCGSGILAIAAAKLGARPILGIDIDPQAVSSTLYNAQVNGVQIHAQDTKAAKPESAQVVVANILSNPLKLLAPLLSSLVLPGGHLALSGVLVRQVDEVAAAYAPWIELTLFGQREGWACLTGKKTR